MLVVYKPRQRGRWVGGLGNKNIKKKYLDITLYQEHYKPYRLISAKLCIKFFLLSELTLGALIHPDLCKIK